MASAGALPETPFKDQTIPGSAHEEGEAKWVDSLQRKSSKACADTSPMAAFTVGRPSGSNPRDDAGDCVELAS